MLSDLRIRKLKPQGKDQWISDGSRSGLYLRMRSTGSKSWVLRRQSGNITLGPFRETPDSRGLTLQEARQRAGSLSGKVVHNNTLGDVLNEWFAERVEKRHRRPHHVEGYIRRLDPALKATKLREIERLPVRQSLRRYAEKHGPVAANRLLSVLKTAMKWACDAGYIESSPISGLSTELIGGEEEARARVLTDAEIRRLWRAESQHAPLLRFLLLTGQRIGETQRATWSHIHGDRWVIPAEHAKNGREHWVALSRQALRVLASNKSERALIFGIATDTGVQAWLRRWCERERISPAFRPHDLRRTFATRLNDLGVMPHVVERAINHTMQGVMAVYNRAEYEAERVEAMQRWADELERITKEASTDG